MRYAASMSQFLQCSVEPVGALTGREGADKSDMARPFEERELYLSRQAKATSIAPMLSPQAPYARVKQFLKKQLAHGRWPPGALMPSEAELVARFGVSRMTVNRALRELQGEGFVDRVQGVGTFAAQLHRVSSTLTIRDLHEEIVARGHEHHAEVHLAREEQASPALAERLGLAPGGAVFYTLIVHLENGVPLQCEVRYVNPVCAPQYLAQDFTRVTPTHYLLEVA